MNDRLGTRALLGLTVLLLTACGGGDSDRSDAGPDPADGGSEDAAPITPVTCGNARVEDGESCDDGDTESGDGCSRECAVEDGFSCPATGGPCTECGDGALGSSESCDDGNAEGGDGCSANCQIEDGWQCPIGGAACESCGNGVLESNERCDEGDFADGVGCSDDCRTIHEHFICPEPGAACAECGDGTVSFSEACDDGNVESGDGCVANCMAVESGWVCPQDGGACALCGDGVIDPLNEECDDGNFQSGDGCSDVCRQESGAVCLQAGVLCSVCGNGFIEFIRLDDAGTPDDPDDDFYDADDPEALERCDDGNAEDGDGCSDDCTLEDDGDLPWLCPLPGVGCGRCGDGQVQAIEICDDGVDDATGLPADGDGCSADCTTVEPSHLCPLEGGACVQCGDGVLDAPLEACDDGNTLSGDGCNRRCAIETDAPWVCPEPNAPCELCGNGLKEAHEACDDGNTGGGDGCSADCGSEEDDYNCYFDGFPCAPCGDGLLQPGEQCDEGHLATPANATDGCIDCRRQAPWACPSPGSSCELCGDGLIGNGDAATAFETCDDGNTLSSDGCSSECQVEPGFVCDAGACAAAACGDGIAATGEECDDGNRNAGDGCSFLCRIEPGFTCSGAAGCRRTRCGDGIVEGDEACDDGGAVCSGGTADGADCVDLADHTACVEGGGSCAAAAGDGCDASCQIELGFKCDVPGQPCTEAYCGDGLVEGIEECDVGGATCVAPGDPLDGTPCLLAQDFAACAAVDPGVSGCEALNANGCDPDCLLVDGFACEPGETCEGADPATDCCVPTYCGDGLVEGTEECDDGLAVCVGGATMDGMPCPDGSAFEACAADGGSCQTQPGDGCDVSCRVEDFYRCRSEDGMASECRPIVQYVSIRRFKVASVSPEGLNYDPDRRSFGGHKSQGSLKSIEMCLDGTVIDQGNTTAGPNGTIFRASGTVEHLPIDCSQNPGAEPCYEAPIRPDVVSSSNLQTLRDSTYDPVSGHILFTHAKAGGGTLLVQLPSDIDPNASVDVRRYAVALTWNAYGVTIGEDGDLYAVDADAELIRVLPRLRDAAGNPLPPPDCSAVADLTNVNCTSFSSTADAARQRDAASDNPLDAIFTLPGESLVGVFNRHTGAATYAGVDLLDGATVTNANYFSFYDTESLDAPRRSALPGVLFSLGAEGTSYTNPGKAAETAADGGAFIMCVYTSSEDCQIFAKVCEADADCPSGALCNLDSVADGGIGFCNSPGMARDDAFQADRDAHKECTSTGTENGNDCSTSTSASACLADGGTCEQVGENAPQPLPVLANDSLSESACVDPRFTILAICGDGVEQPYEAEHADDCDPETEPVPLGTVTLTGDGEVTYDAPDDGSCGFIDTFRYTVDLGGGVIDTAVVRVAVDCVCGDGVVDGSEQCDDGAFNGAAGNCVENCDGDAADQVLARCNAECLLNVLCGDGYIVSPEQCDDRNTENGDGCSSVCTRESDCGNGVVERGEDCDDGPSGSADCNPNCTRPACGDGNLDAGEQCDDGNLRVADGCNASCQIETFCGNGVVEAGEDCDDGNTAPGDGCGSGCRVENVCGNGVREGSEVCDGAQFGSCPTIGGVQIQCVNSVASAPNVCLCQNYCGDGRIGATEECDDGEGGSAACRGADPDQGQPCTEIRCGDGVVDEGEACDDGNTNPADACSNDCRPRALCGNGVVEAPEECDDDNTISGDGCTSTCQTEAANCGDGVLDGDEQCDDDNVTAGDGCDANCRLETVCGDGTKDVGEQCDDGNTMGGDGCSPSCRFEVE